ncbi:hypothetical protein B566_EDAN006147 [Ephemera danica]|nr:hypothetical protein B566_EDAN006147 [Ephemera danica]
MLRAALVNIWRTSRVFQNFAKCCHHGHYRYCVIATYWRTYKRDERCSRCSFVNKYKGKVARDPDKPFVCPSVSIFGSQSDDFPSGSVQQHVIYNSKPELKSVGPKLVPFFKTTAIYFVLFLQTPSLTATVVKCLPVLSLALFVLMHGISLGHQHAFSRRILAGLVLSCVGDACLVWPGYFVHGMAAFGLAQICYCTAFGFRPLNLPAGAILYLFTTIDMIIGFDRFYSQIPNAQVFIMLTYYAAQLGIALSVVDSCQPPVADKTRSPSPLRRPAAFSATTCHKEVLNNLRNSDPPHVIPRVGKDQLSQ